MSFRSFGSVFAEAAGRKEKMSRKILLALILSFICQIYARVDGTSPPPALMKLNTTAVHFYKLDRDRYCPAVEIFVKAVVQKWYFKDPSYTAAFLRLFYSDCFVNGCDGSILLDGKNSEKMAKQNNGLRGFEVVDDIKKVLEVKCPGKVSCSDILALATRDFVALAGGPAYPTPTGRKDGRVSSAKNVKLPSPDISLRGAVAFFQSKGLELEDLVTLLGAHNVGKGHCRYVKSRLNNYKRTGKPDPRMNSTLLSLLKKNCSKGDAAVFMTPSSDSNQYVYDNTYYQRILSHEAFFGIDQALAYNKTTLELVRPNAEDFDAYKFAIADSMARMSLIGVLTGDQGEIRTNCRIRNKYNPF